MAQDVSGGFDGAVTGMSLVDLLQVKGMSRFTGRIAIERGEKTGLLFFRDGDVIHAELDRLEGRAAFDTIVVWGSGSFRVEPKVSTTRQTISDGLQFLLLDALRLQDEAAAARQQEPPAQPESRQEKGTTVKDRLAGVGGLVDAVLTNRQGEVVQAVGPGADALAAQGMYLVMTTERIGDGMGLGAFKGGVIQGAQRHLIVLEGPKNYLFAEASAESKPAVVEGDIRRALSGQG